MLEIFALVTKHATALVPWALRDDVVQERMTYAAVGRELGTSSKRVHNDVTAVQNAFREVPSEIDIEPRKSRRGGARSWSGEVEQARPTSDGLANVPEASVETANASPAT